MTSAELIAIARAHGFHRAAATPVAPTARMEDYRAWLAAGMHGEMTYLASPEHLQLRDDVRELLPEARTVVVVALAYTRHEPPPPATPDGLVPLRGRIARYARGDDYHMLLRDKLTAMANELATLIGRPVAARPCYDAAPVLERDWAERAGIGFIAKNTMLIAPGLGSYVVLGELLLDITLDDTPPLSPKANRCGSCTACLDACPTSAFVDAYLLDARRCISYLTIEHRGIIARELRPLIGTWIFGCDVCQEVCPFNAGSGEPPDLELRPRSIEHAIPDLVRLATLPSNQLRHYVKRTSLRRATRPQLLRNIAIALGNTADPRAIPPLVELVSHANPLVRVHAAWALEHVANFVDDDSANTARAARAARAAIEHDPDVLAELV